MEPFIFLITLFLLTKSVWPILPPVIHTVTRRDTLKEGDVLKLECAVYGEWKTPEYQWFKNNRPISQSPTVKVYPTREPIISNGTSVSVIAMVLGWDDNDANISCRAHVTRRRGDSEPETVKYKPLVILYKPRVSVRPTEVQVNEGEAFALMCNVQGKPQITSIRWYKEWTEYGNDYSPIIRKAAATADDYGLYRCVARNDLGQGIASARVIVHTPGTISSLWTISVTSRRTDVAKWSNRDKVELIVGCSTLGAVLVLGAVGLHLARWYRLKRENIIEIRRIACPPLPLSGKSSLAKTEKSDNSPTPQKRRISFSSFVEEAQMDEPECDAYFKSPRVSQRSRSRQSLGTSRPRRSASATLSPRSYERKSPAYYS